MYPVPIISRCTHIPLVNTSVEKPPPPSGGVQKPPPPSGGVKKKKKPSRSGLGTTSLINDLSKYVKSTRHLSTKIRRFQREASEIEEDLRVNMALAASAAAILQGFHEATHYSSSSDQEEEDDCVESV